MAHLPGSRKVVKPKRLASSGRNVEGATYRIVDAGGERQLRCKFCEALIPIAKRWEHVCTPAAPA